MKDKNQLIDIVLIICAFVLMFKNAVDEAAQAKITNPENEKTEAVHGEPVNIEVPQNLGNGMQNAIAVEKSTKVEKSFSLGNDVIDLMISDCGGTTKSVSLRKYRAIQDRPNVVIFNEDYDMNTMSLSSSNEQFTKFLQSE
jgi:hypothetical protein